ncbi:MAG: hypothetical protein LBR16_09705 [Treponema sp.]|nr:hypothetical protein [Treponema sp.]
MPFLVEIPRSSRGMTVTRSIPFAQGTHDALLMAGGGETTASWGRGQMGSRE